MFEIIQILGCWLLGLVLGIKLRTLSTRILSHFRWVQSPQPTCHCELRKDC